jgi:hypothetical protein
MTDKAAMKLALEALETEVSIDWTNNDEFNASAEKMHEAIAAIKEALADPMRETQRLGQEIEQDADSFCDSNCVWTDHHPDCKLAQPEQEPVAHCKVRPLRGDESFPKVEIDWVNQPVPGPLFTTPPQRTEDAARLDFVLEKAAYVTSSILNRKQVFQLQADGGVVLSGKDQFFSTAREAIDGALEAAHDIEENKHD